MKRNFWSMLLVVAMMLNLIVGASTVVTAQARDIGISSVGDFIEFAESVNSGNDYAGINVYLETDIVLNAKLLDSDGNLINNAPEEWIAIGTEEAPFRGNFDGNGHVISGMYINNEETSKQGVFGVVSGAQIRNIYVYDSYINVHSEAGAIVGYAKDKSVITSCHNVDCYITTAGRSGGIAGWTSNSDVYNCTNTGYCFSGRCAGGIVGDVYSNGKIYNCENSGTVAGDNLVGGISGGTTSADIRNCLSVGDVANNYMIAGGPGSRTITNCFAYKNDSINKDAGGEAFTFSNIEATLNEGVKINDQSYTTVVSALNAYATTIEAPVPMTAWSQYNELPYLNRENIKTTFGSTVSGWSKVEIEDAYKYDLIPENLVGQDLTKPITRLEFAAVAVKVFENLSGVKALPATINPFKDCNDVEMLKAYNQGITIGVSATEFNPDGLLDREQAATMLTRVFKRATMPGWSMDEDSEFKLSYNATTKFADDEYISDWAKESVYFMNANGIILGVDGNKFAPKNLTDEDEAKSYANATREQALLIAVRMVENLK